VDVDGREHIDSGRGVHVPVRQIIDDPGGICGVERLGGLPRGGDENSCTT